MLLSLPETSLIPAIVVGAALPVAAVAVAATTTTKEQKTRARDELGHRTRNLN